MEVIGRLFVQNGEDQSQDQSRLLTASTTSIQLKFKSFKLLKQFNVFILKP